MLTCPVYWPRFVRYRVLWVGRPLGAGHEECPRAGMRRGRKARRLTAPDVLRGARWFDATPSCSPPPAMKAVVVRRGVKSCFWRRQTGCGEKVNSDVSSQLNQVADSHQGKHRLSRVRWSTEQECTLDAQQESAAEKRVWSSSITSGNRRVLDLKKCSSCERLEPTKRQTRRADEEQAPWRQVTPSTPWISP